MEYKTSKKEVQVSRELLILMSGHGHNSKEVACYIRDILREDDGGDYVEVISALISAREKYTGEEFDENILYEVSKEDTNGQY